MKFRIRPRGKDINGYSPSQQALTEQAARLHAKVQYEQERSHARLTGRLHKSKARRGEEELTAVWHEIQRLEVLVPELRRQTEAASAEAERAVRESPTVNSAVADRQTAAQRLGEGLESAYEAADMAVRALGTVMAGVSAPTRLPDPIDAVPALHALHRQLEGRLPLLSQRQELTRQWQTAIGQDPRQLVPELVRYAQVVGATCIGAASRPELSGVEFDLGIIDEAGQISVADALVPLARVRRGVLVGDDRQLPPFLDSAAADWAQDTGDPEILRLTSQSALEQPRAGLPSSHVIQLTKQRRMPAEIADFISASFYRGELLTEKEHRHTDPLFASPLALVDTALLPEHVRRESGGHRAEGRGLKGSSNPCEARLLARLAAYYHRRGSEWVVIVPYLAQRLEVIGHLTSLIGDSELAEASVGSVDSYQGGEREVVLYGFTRSNSQGRVGFLSELRRTNVAFTRAKSQLVPVGDLSTLLRADDPGFRTLADDLHRHVLDRGDLRDYQEVMAALDEAAPETNPQRPFTSQRECAGRMVRAAWRMPTRSARVCGMNPDETEMRAAVRELAAALETMLNLIRAEALPTTPEAHRLLRKAMVFLDTSSDRITAPDSHGEARPLAAELNELIASAREKILDDAVAASPVPDHPGR